MDDQCAVNTDGTLKDPCDIEWEYSPTQKLSVIPLVAPPSPSPAVPGPRSAITFGAQLTPASFAPALKHQADTNNSTKSAIHTKSKAISKTSSSVCQNGKDASNAKVTQPPKPVAFDYVKAMQGQSVASSDAGGETDDNGDGEPRKKKCKKGKGATDIMTVFRTVDANDLSQGYECEICVTKKNENLKKYAKLQTVIKGNNSTIQPSILSFTQTIKKPGEEWTKEQFNDFLLCFIVETDQALSIVDHNTFCELLLYNGHNKTKSADIPHQTKVTELVLAHATEIQADLANELQIDGSHSGKNLGVKLYDVFKQYGICDKIQNLTSDNVTMNDKSMRSLREKLKDDKITFDAKQQHSYCFSHAVAISKCKFLSKFLPSMKKKSKDGEFEDVPIILPPSEADKEDTEEDIQIQGFITKVRHSPQAKKYFKKCCQDAWNEVLKLLPYCKTHWASWYGVITRLLILRKLDLQAAAEIQEAFLAEYYPTVWRILLLYEDFITKLCDFAADPKMAVLWLALKAGIESLKKYYNKMDNSPVHIISMYLNPCVKDEYFKIKFDKYEKLYTSQQAVDGSSNAGQSALSAISCTSSSSLIARATESRRTHEQLSTKDAQAELKIFLTKDLFAVNEYTGLMDTKQHARLLPKDFGDIQMVKCKYKQE
ncbi:hypothetical protein BDR06DRAFT_976714 [Suillus hirtellus]|nr:hypothetical protein BDR06DRAFT_976714 [Suillus hirtellus]